MVTGRPIPLKKFIRGGNLIVANVDMDGAQVLGFCRAVMKYNDPEALVPDFTLAGPAVDPMFDLFPTFDFRFNDTTTSQGFNAPGSFPSHEFPDAPFDPNIFGLTNYNAPITSEPGFSGDHFTPPDPTLFGLSADFNAQIPSGAPVENPLQDFMALFGPYGIPGDVGMASDIFSASTESHLENQLPLLPPLPPASPV
ncbi:hypothetical protein B0H10DRAFT_1964870 [Mycena sp. CBHHK59/15]|nr:hypothetical protein B0H10DRAFT_1964870 [Mycena sp. CBHHK59/15]